MANIILPRKWTQQPQYPVEIDWNNPLALDIISIQDARGFDYVTGQGTLANNDSINTVYTEQGEGKSFGTNSLSFPIAANIGDPYGGSLLYLGTQHTVYWGIGSENNGMGLACPSDSFGIANITSTTGANDGSTRWQGIGVIVGVCYGQYAPMGLWVNGVRSLSAVRNTGVVIPANTSIMTKEPAQIGILSIRWKRKLGEPEVRAISENPWQIFKRRSRRIWVGGVAGGDITLAAAAASQATASASLTTAIPITAAALGIGTATASLSTAIPLSGVAASVASGSGALTAQVRLSADALAQAVSAAALSSGIILTAAAVAQAAAAGTLSSAIQLIANAAAQASAPASLTAGSSGLAANAQASASASAALTIQIQLSAAALAQAAASASLTAASSGLSAAASTSASAQGNITTQIKLSAAALAEAIAVGGLTARIDLAANAITTADASAWMLTAVQLAADASVISTAAAALTGGSLSVVRYQALTVDVFPVELTVDVFPIILTADVF